MAPAFVSVTRPVQFDLQSSSRTSSTTSRLRTTTFITPFSPRHATINPISNINNKPTEQPLQQPTMAIPAPGEKIDVAVLGATGSVGQRFMQLLDNHPWFRVAVLGASSRSAGKPYHEAVTWKQSVPIPSDMASLTVSTCDVADPVYSSVKIVFSGMDAEFAGDIEEDFAKAGKAVFSNARCHRMDSDVPILIPPVNLQHLDMIHTQRKNRGFTSDGLIITNANCSTTALAIGIKPIAEKFGIDSMVVSTMQAISGAGYPGLSSMDILDNVVPLIGGEEEKMESESKKILGVVKDGSFHEAEFNVSAMCNRVNVLDGHTECVSINLKNKASVDEVIDCIKNYPSVTKDLGLPSAPDKDVLYHSGADRPQPRLDRMVGNGYTVTIGRVRDCNVFDIRMVLFGHNTIVGAAGGSLINAELCVIRDFIN